jgi:hypothetical protein
VLPDGGLDVRCDGSDKGERAVERLDAREVLGKLDVTVDLDDGPDGRGRRGVAERARGARAKVGAIPVLER